MAFSFHLTEIGGRWLIRTNASMASARVPGSFVRELSVATLVDASGPNAPSARAASRRTAGSVLASAVSNTGRTCLPLQCSKPRTWMAPHAVPSLLDIVAFSRKGIAFDPAAGCCPKAQIAHICDHSSRGWTEWVKTSMPSGPTAARTYAASLIEECQKLV